MRTLLLLLVALLAALCCTQTVSATDRCDRSLSLREARLLRQLQHERHLDDDFAFERLRRLEIERELRRLERLDLHSRSFSSRRLRLDNRRSFFRPGISIRF